MTAVPVIDRGEGPPVVLVHGAGGSAATSFAAAVPVLARRQRVLAVDLPEPVTAPAGGWTLDTVADAVADAVAARTDVPVLLLGHSLGAAVVARIAVRHPRLAHDVVLAAAPLTRDARLWLTTRLWARLFALDRTALAEHLVLTTTSPSWLAGLDEADVADLVRLAAELVPDSTGLHLDLAEATDLAADVPRIAARVTAVLGEEDPLVPVAPWTAAAASGLVGALVWPGGHDVLAQNPHELAALVAGLTTTRTREAPTHDPRRIP